MKDESEPTDGWTDDLSLTVAPEHTLDELVTFVLDCDHRGTPRSEMMRVLTIDFGLSFNDARLAEDRVFAGRFLVQTNSNAPDPHLDPIAHISYRRAQGAPALLPPLRTTSVWRTLMRLAEAGNFRHAVEYTKSPEFAELSRTHEFEAARLWCGAVTASQHGTQEATSSTAVVRLFELAEALVRPNFDKAILTNVMLQVATAVSSVGESRIDELSEQPYATAGTPTWFDAIILSEVAAKLSTMFRENGDDEYEATALEVRGRITTRLLGHCPHRVGAAMLDSVRCAIRHGETARAASLCEAVINDFARVVEECEVSVGGALDEDEIALRQLVEAIDIHNEIQGQADENTQRLLDRCQSLLQQHPKSAQK